MKCLVVFITSIKILVWWKFVTSIVQI